jgi:serine phosphatase RsbU (regulator of sigma subunit)
MNPRGDLFEPDRLASAVREGRALPAQALLQAVRRRLEEFAEGAAPADDLTLVALRVVA